MEIALVISALGLGFASGFHCVGMCGPIALSMGLTKSQTINFHLQNLTYNLGRIVTYSLLGMLLGLIGEGFQLVGVQGYLTIAVGVLLIVMAVFSFGGNDFASKISFLSRLLLNVKISLGKLLQQKDYKSRFFTGLLNGLLPCGMVYMALTASLASGGVWQGGLFMALFGLGTLPFMFVVVLVGTMVTQAFRIRVLKLIPFVMVVLGVLFIVRGMELGIPYLSPKEATLKIHQPLEYSSQSAESCH